MRKYYRVSEAAEKLHLSPSTVKLYTEQGKIECDRTPSGHRVFTEEHLNKYLGIKPNPKHKAYYARSSGDNTIINSQLQKLTELHGEPDYTIKDRASGLNEKRPGLQKLMHLAKTNKIDSIYVTSKDRLTRFGYTYLEAYFEQNNVAIHYLNDTKEENAQEELMNDFMTLIGSFSGKLYRLRTKKHQKLLLEKAQEKIQEASNG